LYLEQNVQMKLYEIYAKMCSSFTKTKTNSDNQHTEMKIKLISMFLTLKLQKNHSY